MPTYEYECRKCGHRFELFHSIKDETPKRCPRCKGRAVRVPSAGAGILFKGSGFYITDYRSKDYRKQAKQEKGEGGKPSESTPKESKESKTSESKPSESKPKDKPSASKRKGSSD